MKNYEKIYNKLSKIYFVIHVLLFVLIFAASFFPFCEDLNFYQFLMLGYPWMPYVSLALLLISVWASYRARKRPLFSILAFLLSVGFYILIFLGIYVPAYLTMVLNELFGDDASFPYTHNVGFDVIVETMRVIYIDILFIVYAIVVAALKIRDKIAEKKTQKESKIAM